MKISVVVPTYRRPELLTKCITSLLVQNFEEHAYEIIVVSDGPDPITKKLVNEFREMVNIHFLSLPNKKGPAAARNLGWRHANGRLIAFTDDDCLADKNWLMAAWQHYNDENEIAFSGRVIVPVPPNPTDHELNTAHLQTAEFITANCFCTKKALEKVDGFDERFTLAWREDSDLQFKLLLQKIPIVKLEEAIVTHPVRKAPWGNSLKEQKKGMFDALLYKKYPQLYRQRAGYQPPWNYYILTASLVMLVAGLLMRAEKIITISAIIWLLFTLHFIFKRLSGTSRAPDHITEMVFTSILIPVLSLYWHWYGAFKYRVFFI